MTCCYGWNAWEWFAFELGKEKRGDLEAIMMTVGPADFSKREMAFGLIHCEYS